MEPEEGSVPAPLHRADSYSEQDGGVSLRQALVKEQADHLAFLRGQALDLLVDLAPVGQALGIVRFLGAVGRL